MLPARVVVVLVWVLAGLVFVIDLRVAGLAASMGHVLVLGLGLWLPSPRAIPWLTATCAGLTVTSWFIAGHDESAFGLANLGLILAAIVLTGGGVFSYRRSERRRLATAERVRDLQRALDQAAILAITDVRGTITYVNDAFCRVSGYSRVELIGQDHRLLNSGWHPPEFFREMFGTLGRGEVWRGEFRNRAKDGSFYWVDTTIVPFLDDRGHPYQFVAIHYDVTERRAAETRLRDQAALTQLGRMAAVVAHEVRNPLAGMRGALQLILPRLADEADRHIGEEVIGRVDALGDIVQDLLEFARPRTPAIGPVAATELLGDVDVQFHADGRQPGIRIVIDAGDVVLDADRSLLTAALLSVVLNAAQAMKGTGVVRLEARTTPAGHEIRVHDEGPGIPPEVRAHLFEPFFTTKHQGTGLGLATVKRTIADHGGYVEVACPEGGGTTVVITLPTAPPASGGPRPPAAPRPA